MKSDRPSRTASVVAAATLAAFQRGLKPSPTNKSVTLTRRMLGVGLAGRGLVKSLDSSVGQYVWRRVERLAAPGFVHHIARRKAWIERACRAAMADGYQRVVIVGAGFDTLGTRLALEAAVEVIEIDHPATQQAKAASLQSGVTRLPFMIPVDLATQLPGVVLGALAQGDHPRTFMVIEGVMMYLPWERVEQLLDDILMIRSERLRVVMTYMESEPGGVPGFRPRPALVSAWLRLVGESFRWGSTRGAFSGALLRRGFETLDLADGSDLARLWPGEVLMGEVAVLAERVGAPP